MTHSSQKTEEIAKSIGLVTIAMRAKEEGTTPAAVLQWVLRNGIKPAALIKAGRPGRPAQAFWPEDFLERTANRTESIVILRERPVTTDDE